MSIEAPWTAEQVDNLNRFQRFGMFHPFTCPGHEGGGDRTLVATRGGWICPHCDYRQKWEHEKMATFTAEAAAFFNEHSPFASPPPRRARG